MRADTIAAALGGRRVGSTWMVRCPAHDDRTPSLSIQDADDGRILVRCHAGCSQAKVIASLQLRGLWKVRAARSVFARSGPRGLTPRQPDRDEVKRTVCALAIWQAAMPAAGTPVEAYLASRGLRLSLPATLRFHPGLKHPSGTTWPAMVALVTRGSDPAPLAIHRTFLARDGRGKAPVVPSKMMLGPCGGGAVHLAPSNGVLMVGEGIETCLAAMQATGRSAWAALSTSGLRRLELPADVSEVIVLADGDEPGEAAARDVARRWVREGRRVRIAHPPTGMDFNDMLVGHAHHADGGAR